MEKLSSALKTWKAIPLSLKILFVVLVLWIIGSFFAISARSVSGLPFFWWYVYGDIAAIIVILLDIVAPAAFLYALWNRKSRGVPLASFYMTVFILNSVVALFTVREELWLMPILMPAIVNIIFLIVIYRNKSYFDR